MDHPLIQKLNELARNFAIEHKAREFNGPLTPARGRVLAPQWALFNRNRRDCWGAVQCSSPLEVKRAVWRHESEELIADPRCGSDHYSLHVRRCLAVGLTMEQIEKAEPLPGCRAAFYGWLYIARTRPWLQALSASSILERAVDRSVVPRDVQAEVTKWVRDLGVSEKDMEVLTANDNADEDHSAMFEEIFIKAGNTPEGEAMILDGARESLDMMGTFYDALNQEMTRCK
jgi:pyrroloquinoline quinone (PQQ) biosynthesis protein C